MAQPKDAQNAQTAKRSLWKPFPIVINVKRFLRWLGFPVKDRPETGFQQPTDLPIFKNLRNEIDFKILAELNDLQWKTELKWDGLWDAKPDDLDFLKSAHGLWDQVVNVYSRGWESSDKIKEGIGPFVDEAEIRREASLTGTGTGFDKRGYTTMPSILDANGRPKKLYFSIPKEVDMIHNSGWRYKLAFFGYQNPSYWQALKADIDDICRQIEEASLAVENDQGIRNNIIGNIENYREMLKSFLDLLAEEIREFEEGEHYSNTGSGTGIVNLYTRMKTLKTNVYNMRIDDKQTHYTHTYKIVKPEIVDNNGNTITFAHAHPNWQVRGKEVAPGLDENGWPLEVGDGETRFDGRTPAIGEILLDYFENMTSIRKVKQEFITECSLLDVVTWIYVSYDAFRDDLRDGRYHTGSMSIMEYLMSRLKPLDMETLSEKDYRAGRHPVARIKLNKLSNYTGEPLRPNIDPNYVDWTITPTHLNPAFDLRVKHKHKHIGRKFYYAVQGDINEFAESHPNWSKAPTITTRGAALYILHRVIEQTKYWGGGQDPNKIGVIEVLRAIGELTSGYDIGANLSIRWGKPLTKNPFRPKQSG
ncbi:hypothetical protein HYW99_01860 [Candidatus Woesearchaeota archaeon]|nr:hypothetical protein [Candidatus Woesearchaeota archaeon]